MCSQCLDRSVFSETWRLSSEWPVKREFSKSLLFYYIELAVADFVEITYYFGEEFSEYWILRTPVSDRRQMEEQIFKLLSLKLQNLKFSVRLVWHNGWLYSDMYGRRARHRSDMASESQANSNIPFKCHLRDDCLHHISSTRGAVAFNRLWPRICSVLLGSRVYLQLFALFYYHQYGDRRGCSNVILVARVCNYRIPFRDYRSHEVNTPPSLKATSTP